MNQKTHVVARLLFACGLASVGMATGALSATPLGLEDVQLGERGNHTRIALMCNSTCNIEKRSDTEFMLHEVGADVSLDLSERSKFVSAITFAPDGNGSLMRVSVSEVVKYAHSNSCTIGARAAACIDLLFATGEPADVKIATTREPTAYEGLPIKPPKPAVRESTQGEWDIGAELSGEVRYFQNEATFPGQFDHWQASFALEPDIRWETDDRKHQFVLIPFFRFDGKDNERTHVDLREAYYRFNSDHNWSLTVGAAKVFWGRAESRHLVDIINQTDAIEDIDEEDKLGQPMVNLTLVKSWGTLDFFVMSGFRTQTFPGMDGRLRFQLVVDTENPIFERSARRGAVDYAARYAHYVDNWDFGFSLFHGTSREARFAFAPGGYITPVYDRITQGGIDFQYTKDAWLWKTEVIARKGHGDTFFAGVAGVEYTQYQIFGTNSDLGLLAEYQYDGRDEGFVTESFGTAFAAPITAANNDVFAGTRLALNDPQDTSALVGVTVDADDQSMGMFIEAQRRLGQNWTAELETRLFFNIDPVNIAAPLRDDDFVTLSLTRFF